MTAKLKQAPDFRSKLSDDLRERYDTMLKTVDDGMAATKAISIECPHCRRLSKHAVPDTKAALEAARFLVEHAIGRPSVNQDAPDQEQILFVRVTVEDPSDESIDRAVAAAVAGVRAAA